MYEEKERQKEIREKLESEGFDPDLSACSAQAGEFDGDPPSYKATDGHSEQPASGKPNPPPKTTS